MHILSGFSLLEILITLAIIAILTTVAYPIYRHNLVHGRRKHAQALLLSLGERLENYYSTHGDYQHVTLNQLQVNIQDELFYRFELHHITAQKYLLQAAPLKSQLEDDCGVLSINETGERKARGRDPVDCWQ